MKLTFFGVGYVGLVSGVCLADLGNEVTLVGRNEVKIEDLKKGIVPIYEPGLDKLIKKNRENLHFTTNSASAIKASEVLFVAVGTPSNKDGSCDLSQVEDVSKIIAQHIDKPKVIVIKSTVPVGSDEMIRKIIKSKYKGDFSIASNPEFLREGSAISDFMKPDRVVIGTEDEWSKKVLDKIYRAQKVPIIHTDIRSAQLIKYASNAFLATKITFINEMANFAEKVGGNIEKIAEGMGYDKRIGSEFLKAGIGYGGSCFPKDVKELIFAGKSHNSPFHVLQAVDEVNNKQKIKPVEKLEKMMNLKDKTVGVIGLSFKPNTDDIRDASSIDILFALLKKGAKIKTWDPIAEQRMQTIFPKIEYCPTPYEALAKVDAAIIVTEWDETIKLDLKKVKKLMKKPVIIDGRNCLDKETALKLGFKYQGIGR